jgi:hypothetical protein
MVREKQVHDVVDGIARALKEYSRESASYAARELAVLLMEKLHNEGLTIVPKGMLRRVSG